MRNMLVTQFKPQQKSQWVLPKWHSVEADGKQIVTIDPDTGEKTTADRSVRHSFFKAHRISTGQPHPAEKYESVDWQGSSAIVWSDKRPTPDQVRKKLLEHFDSDSVSTNPFGSAYFTDHYLKKGIQAHELHVSGWPDDARTHPLRHPSTMTDADIEKMIDDVRPYKG
jgi:hypothetical protein